jgi:hypothetical protein
MPPAIPETPPALNISARTGLDFAGKQGEMGRLEQVPCGTNMGLTHKIKWHPA